MSETLTASAPELREAMYSLSLLKDIPDAGVLDNVVRRYPQYSAELTSFAIAIAVDIIRGSAIARLAEDSVDSTATSTDVSRALSRFQNRLHSIKTNGQPAAAATPSSVPAANPFAGLNRDQFRGFASRLGANTVFAAKLRDRQIDPNTMSDGFKRRVANNLEAPIEVIVAHFAAQQGSAAHAQFFKADHKPTDGGRQSFEDAVRGSGLSEDQQKNLLAL